MIDITQEELLVSLCIVILILGALIVWIVRPKNRDKKNERLMEEEKLKAEFKAEIERCKSPYYFMTTYWQIGGKMFKTNMNQRQFDERFAALSGYDYEPMYPMNDESLQGSAAKEL